MVYNDHDDDFTKANAFLYLKTSSLYFRISFGDVIVMVLASNVSEYPTFTNGPWFPNFRVTCWVFKIKVINDDSHLKLFILVEPSFKFNFYSQRDSSSTTTARGSCPESATIPSGSGTSHPKLTTSCSTSSFLPGSRLSSQPKVFLKDPPTKAFLNRSCYYRTKIIFILGSSVIKAWGWRYRGTLGPSRL